jgi:hypothetical protein
MPTPDTEFAAALCNTGVEDRGSSLCGESCHREKEFEQHLGSYPYAQDLVKDSTQREWIQ